MIVTIDGTAGSGKSSVAKELSRRYGYRHINTGGIYRGVTLLGIEAGIDLNNVTKLRGIAEGMSISFRPDKILINGKDRTNDLFVPQINVSVGPATLNPGVRRIAEQILYAETAKAESEGVDMVAEGRDVGKHLSNKANFKFYLTADLSTRVGRSLRKQFAVWDEDTQVAEERRLTMRDKRDLDLGNGPQPDQVLIDTTGLTLFDTMDKIEGLMNKTRAES